MSIWKFRQAQKHFRIEAGDPVQDSGFDVIHLLPIRYSELVLLGYPLSEFLEGQQDICAEVRLDAISPHCYTRALDVQRVSDRLEVRSQPRRFRS